MAVESLRSRSDAHRIHGIYAQRKTLLLRIYRTAPQTMTNRGNRKGKWRVTSGEWRATAGHGFSGGARFLVSACHCEGATRPILMFSWMAEKSRFLASLGM